MVWVGKHEKGVQLAALACQTGSLNFLEWCNFLECRSATGIKCAPNINFLTQLPFEILS